MPKGKLTTKEHQVYMPGKNGPFRCDNCEYYNGNNQCYNEKIVALAREGKFGLELYGFNTDSARVEPDGCSDEYEPK